MLENHQVQGLAMFGGELPLLVQDLAERLALVENPCLHGAQERVPRDEVELQGQHAVEQVAVGMVARHRSISPRPRRSTRLAAGCRAQVVPAPSVSSLGPKRREKGAFSSFTESRISR